MENTHIEELFGNIDFDEFFFELNDKKKSLVGPNKHMPKEYIEVDSKFYYFDSGKNMVRLITITHIRSGICFYTIEDENNSREHWFPIDSVFSIMLEPETYETNLNNKYYEFKPRLGKSKVIYVEDEEKTYLKPHKTNAK